MSQQMCGTWTGAHHPRAAKCLVDDHRDSTRSTEGAIRSTAMDKQRIGIGPRPTFLQVGYDCLTHFLGQWQSRVAASLTKPVSMHSSSRCHSVGDARCRPHEDPNGPAA